MDQDDLAGQLEIARERITQLERALGVHFAAPLCLGLTRKQAQLLGVLMARPIVNHDVLFTALYSAKPHAPGSGVIAAHIFHLRNKLKKFGIEIMTKSWEGYYMTPEMKEKVRALERD